MIQSVELRNFKSIKKKYFPLRKLNLLVGLNGMGKSSFIQSLLLLRQSEQLGEYGELWLGGVPSGYVNLINLGTGKDVRYQYAKKEETIDVFLQFENSDPFEMNFNYEHEVSALRAKKWNRSADNYIMLHKSEPLFTENFQYLRADRIPPRAIHSKSFSEVAKRRNMGSYGEFTTHFIDMFYSEEIAFENLIHKNSVTKDDVSGMEIINKTLINQINLWMGEISPGVNIRTTSISSEEVLLEYVYKQPNFGNTNRFRPENVGFGISYALHVVTALLASKPGELIVIESPESHIHPRGQAELGKLIALTAANDVQLIIETHSDHIINGIRVAIKENLMPKEDAIIFYFDKKVTATEQYSTITNIEIDKNGTLSDYPQDFLDEWSNQLSKLI